MAKSRGALVTILLLLGALFVLSGGVFSLQGEGIVGPICSFLFKNPAPIYDGLLILLGGLVLIGVGLVFRPRRVEPVVAKPN